MSKISSSHTYLASHPVFMHINIITYTEEIREHLMIGSGKSFLCFIYGNFRKFNSAGEEEKIEKIELQPVENYYKLSASPGAKLIAISMKPEYWFNITGVSPRNFNSNPVNSLPVRLQLQLEQLHSSLSAMVDPLEIMEIINSQLQQFYEQWSHRTPVSPVVEEIFNTQGSISIPEILHRFPIAQSTLNAHFSKYIGVPPKFYIKLIHFNFVLRDIMREGKSISEIIYESNYYDYSHFKKDFKKFTGLNPAKMEEMRNSTLEGVFEKMDYALH